MAIGIDDAPRTEREPATGWAALRPLVLRLHFYAGVFVGPFLLVAALTGIAYVWTPQLEQAVYAHELHVPAAAGSVPLDQQVLVARDQVPDGKVIGVRPAPSATDTTQVIFDRPGLVPSYRYTVFVNPHDGEVRGALETYGSGQAMPVRGWIDTLHRNLHLGDFGRLYSELAASWLWVITLAGLALWLGRRRRLRAVLLPSRGPGRRRLRSWHGSAGLWIAAGLLFLSATGLTWSLHAGANITDLRSSLDWTTPSVSSAASRTPGDVGWQAVRDATVRAGLSDPVEIRPPSGGGYVVQQVGRGWPSKQDSMSVDPGTGAVTATLRFADFPLAAKLSRWGIDAHMGLLFGVANQIVLTVLGLALVCVVGWGYRMWWLRGRGRSGPLAAGGWLRGVGRFGGSRSARGADVDPLPEGEGLSAPGEADLGWSPESGDRVRSGLPSVHGGARVGRLSTAGERPRGETDLARLPEGDGSVDGQDRSGLLSARGTRGGVRVGRSLTDGERLRGAADLDWSPDGDGSVEGQSRSVPLSTDGERLRVEADWGRSAKGDGSVGGQNRPGPLPVGRVRGGRSPERGGRSRSRFGRLPMRGAWRRIPGRVLAPVLVGVAVVGWFLPVFGVSLLGFLAVDCLLGLRREAAR
ncbi:PepSY-associated TM helix domain-containing protein [Amycolatopsis circi]|uniref:PepSY-associated TM helix domain-containing protein n=1 Tax=Amycolatopsis circi TaxID=871959 RepID=UPI001FC9F6B0|nr:PepSY-associated TM helix domain-containing protein [Amycolatopsis circi]